MHEGRVRFVTVSDKKVYSASDDGSICIFDLKTGEKQRLMNTDGVLYLFVKKDKLYSSSWDNTVKIWDIATGLCTKVIYGHKDVVTCLYVTESGILYTCSADRTVRQWDATNGAERQPAILHTHDGAVTHLTVSETNPTFAENYETRLFTCSTDKKILVWDIKNNKPIPGAYYSKNALRLIAPDTQEGRIVTADERKVTFRDTKTGKESTEEIFPTPGVRALALTEDLIYMTSVKSEYPEILVWNRWGDRTQKPVSLRVDTDILWIHLAGEKLYCAGENGTVQVWTAIKASGVSTLKGHKSEIISMSVKGDKIYTGSEDNTVRIWNINTKECINILQSLDLHTTLCMQPVDDRLFCGTSNGMIAVWHIETGKLLKHWKASSSNILQLCLSNELVFISSEEDLHTVWPANISIWDSVTQERVEVDNPSLLIFKKNVKAFVLKEDILFCGCQDGMIRALHVGALPSIRLLGELNTQFPVNCLEVGLSGPPDATSWRPISSRKSRQEKVHVVEDFLLFSACGNDIFCWKINNPEPLKKYQYHNGTVTSITLHGDRLFSSSKDKQIAIWDRDNGALLRRYSGHEDSINVISVNDEHLVSVSSDQSVMIWNLQIILAPPLFVQCCDRDNYLEYYDHNEQEMLNTEDILHRNALMFVASYGSIECIRYLLNNFKFDLSAPNVNAETAAYFLFKNTRWRVVSELDFPSWDAKTLELFSANAKDDNLRFFEGLESTGKRYPLLQILTPALCCNQAPMKVLRFILESKQLGFDVNNERDERKRTLLHHSAYFGAPKVVEFLLTMPNIDVNMRDFKGNNALQYALMGESKQPDPLKGSRGYQSKYDILHRRLQCAKLLVSIEDMSKAPDMFAENLYKTNNYFSALIEQDWRIEDLKKPRNSFTDAVRCVVFCANFVKRQIKESNDMFEETAEIVDIIHDYPAVLSYRTKFALKYFAKVTIPYFAWLICLISVTVIRSTNNDQQSFYFGESIRGSFVNNDGMPLSGIGGFDDYWMWFETVLVPGLDALDWHNPGENFTAPEFLSGHRLIGAIKMRQVRVKPDSCAIAYQFADSITTCYNEHDTRSEVQDKSPYGPNNTYVWDPNHDDETPTGELGEIAQGGFIQTFSGKNNSGLELAASLKAGGWLDSRTRAVVINFNIYNVNLNLFGLLTIIVEFPASGMVVTSYSLDNLRMFRYQSTADWVCFAFELFVILYFIYGFLLTELWEIYKRRVSYLTEVWNYYEWMMIIFFFTIIGLRVRSVVLLGHVDFQPLDTMYINFQSAASYVSNEQDINALFILLCMLRGLKFLKLPPYTGPATSSILATLHDRSFVVFVTVYIFVIVSFMFAFHISFGVDVMIMRSLWNSLTGIVQMLFGGFDYPSLEQSNKEFGPLFFLMFMCFSGMVLTNLFIAVLSDIYIGNQQHNTELWEIYITNLLVKALQRGDGIGPNQSKGRQILNRLGSLLSRKHKVEPIPDPENEIGIKEEPVRASGNSVSMTDEDIEGKLLRIHQSRSSSKNYGMVQSIRAEVGTDIIKTEHRLRKELEEIKEENIRLNLATNAKLQGILSTLQDSILARK